MTSPYAKVTAIVRIEDADRVKAALKGIDVKGVTYSKVKGYGEYVDHFARDGMDQYARLEVFTSTVRAGSVVEAILGAASSGTPGDGILCVLPVDQVWRVRSRTLTPPDEL